MIIYSCCCRIYSAYAVDHAPTDTGGACKISSERTRALLTRVHKFPESHSSNINCEHVYTQTVWEECPKQKNSLLFIRKLYAKRRESDFFVFLD